MFLCAKAYNASEMRAVMGVSMRLNQVIMGVKGRWYLKEHTHTHKTHTGLRRSQEAYLLEAMLDVLYIAWKDEEDVSFHYAGHSARLITRDECVMI